MGLLRGPVPNCSWRFVKRASTASTEGARAELHVEVHEESVHAHGSAEGARAELHVGHELQVHEESVHCFD